jgi:hypothetical protein
MSVVPLVAGVAPHGAADARTRREYGGAFAGVGPEDDRAPDDLYADDEICGWAGTQRRPAAPAGATARRRARAVSGRPTGASDLVHASCRRTEDPEGRHTSLTAPETDPPLGGCPMPSAPGVWSRAATRRWCAPCRAIRGISGIASAPWKRAAGWSSTARPGGQPNPCGGPQRVRNGPVNLQAVVMKRRRA